MKKFIYACALAAASLATPGFDAQAETWKPLGTGYLRDDVITVSYILSDYYQFEVEIEESEETPGRYRLVNAYRNCPPLSADVFPEDATNYLVVDASDPVHVYIEQGGTSYYIGQDQQLCLWSIADDYYNNRYGNWELADQEGVCGKMEDGVITFPRGSVLFVPVEETVFNPEDHDFIWQIANKHGKFRILLPGIPRTDISASLMGISDDQTVVNYYINMDSDIEYVQAAVFEGDYTPDMAERIRKTADGTATDAEKVNLTKFSKSGITSFPYEKDGIQTLVMVPYANGKAWAANYDTSEWAYSEAEWKNVGTAQYVESIISSNTLNAYGFVYPSYTYDVPVQQSVSSPWLIRLVDPYGPDCYPEANKVNYDSSFRHFLTFDLSDFDNAMLLYTEDLGITLSNVGSISLWSYADRQRNNQLSQEFIDQYYPDGVPTGKYNPETRELTFEKNAINILFSGNPTAWYSANMNGTFSLKLNSDVNVEENPSMAVDEVFDGETAEPEYFTVSGVRVQGKPASGIYLERRGDKVRKVVVK